MADDKLVLVRFRNGWSKWNSGEVAGFDTATARKITSGDAPPAVLVKQPEPMKAPVVERMVTKAEPKKTVPKSRFGGLGRGSNRSRD